MAEASIEWIASINSEIDMFNRLEGLKEATPEERASYKGANTSMQDGVCQGVSDNTTDQGQQNNQDMYSQGQD
eukprot:8345447-Prorocentrum_lima.AAC.1